MTTDNKEAIVVKPVFTKWQSDTNWCGGTVGKYNFEAKLFDEGSTFGINDGRVSKLSIWDDKERKLKGDFFAGCIVNYDRGWDITPSEENKAIFESVMELLENAPKDRFTKQATT